MASNNSGEGDKPRLRQPIVTVLGHVDHGKTSLLDKIRRTAVAAKEAGGITQHIGASFVPAEVIERIAEPLKKVIPVKLVIPGLLFIDTPGHELFSNLRRRGGSVADFAIVVIDIMEGFQPQTYEAVELLKERRVPFLVAANKIDRIPGWKPNPDEPFIFTIRKQSPEVQALLEQKVYEIVGKLYELGLPAELFTRIKDFTKAIAIVPVSARTGEGVPELLAVLAGLTQQYLKKRLRYAEGPAKGVILEVKEHPGLGTAIDVVIYDGVIRVGDTIVLGGKNGPIKTNVRALLMPRPLQDLRSREARFVNVDAVYAAAGVRIAAPGLDEALAGSPIYVAASEEDVERLMKEVKKELEEIRIRTDKVGVVVKADTLGTLEALVAALKRSNIPVRIADIGPVSKVDVIDASITKKEDPYLGVIIAFNVKIHPEAEEEAKRLGVKIFQDNVIYRLLEDYEKWVEEEKQRERMRKLSELVRPGKFRILPGFIFRRSDPAIVGIKVEGGVIRPGYPVMDEDGRPLGRILAIRDRDRSLPEARLGMEVAVSIQGRILIGRHVDEGDILYTNVPAEHARKLVVEFKDLLSKDELDVLKEIAEIKRRQGDIGYAGVLMKLKSMKA
ncbi:MAG: translation initiation factor IF-2 [Desulfurococcales archaeon]|nr:translation initiation factor IF-2 [Desulfurococcales archaeon]MCE4626455.1 translation initiation factor IF-2 [Desulfurococcales archaeon]